MTDKSLINSVKSPHEDSDQNLFLESKHSTDSQNQASRNRAFGGMGMRSDRNKECKDDCKGEKEHGKCDKEKFRRDEGCKLLL